MPQLPTKTKKFRISNRKIKNCNIVEVRKVVQRESNKAAYISKD